MRHWAITDRASGVVEFAQSADGAPPYDPAVYDIVEIDRAPGEDDIFADGALGIDIERVRARLLAGIDQERNARAAPMLSPGRAVSYAYTAKGAELYNHDVLSAELVASMPPEVLAATFPWLSAEADALGITLSEQADRVRAARAAADIAMRAIEAKAQCAKAAIRAAETLEDMQAAAAVDWES